MLINNSFANFSFKYFSAESTAIGRDDSLNLIVYFCNINI